MKESANMGTEIQLHIWSMAIEPPTVPKTHILMSMTQEYVNLSQRKRENNNPAGSSSIHRYFLPRKGDIGPIVLTKVCPDARATYRDVYTKFPCREGSYYDKVVYHSHDTSNDNFYISSTCDWTDYKILVDLVILQNTTRPPCKQVEADVAGLQRIRHLTVDLNIFGGAPISIVSTNQVFIPFDSYK